MVTEAHDNSGSMEYHDIRGPNGEIIARAYYNPVAVTSSFSTHYGSYTTISTRHDDDLEIAKDFWRAAAKPLVPCIQRPNSKKPRKIAYSDYLDVEKRTDDR